MEAWKLRPHHIPSSTPPSSSIQHTPQGTNASFDGLLIPISRWCGGSGMSSPRAEMADGRKTLFQNVDIATVLLIYSETGLQQHTRSS